MPDPRPTSSADRQAALAFLRRDPFGNAALIAHLLHTRPLDLAVTHGPDGAITGVLLIEPLLESAGSNHLVRLDAIDVAVLPALLARLDQEKQVRLEAHRPWAREYFFRATGWRSTGVSLYTFGLHPSVPLPSPDPGLVRLTNQHVGALGTHPLGWAPSTLRTYLREGRRAVAIERDGQLVARAVTGLPTAQTEEITSVYTAPALRGQGLGKAIAAALAADIRTWGRIPLYVTTADNEASQRVARGLGFRLLTTAHVYEREARN
ncbi:MAG: GNAT family N-acetyltransferase [Ardenticatenaceae bacterium]|nr:GNAT family N-acetyltransferase [Ardenticatenaceae bacterium]HBY96366.1 hypothetical protein [Chloroflexota bacterium]